MVLIGMPPPSSDYSLISCSQLYKEEEEEPAAVSSHLSRRLLKILFFSKQQPYCDLQKPSSWIITQVSVWGWLLSGFCQVQKWSRCISMAQMLRPRSCKYQVPSSLLSHDRPADPFISSSLSYCINRSIVIEGQSTWETVGICEAHLKFRELTGNQVLPCCSLLMHISRIFFYFWLIPLSDRYQNQLRSPVHTATIWILNLLFALSLSFLIGSSIASSYQCIDHHLASVSSPFHLCSSCSWSLFLKSRHFQTSWDLQLSLHVPTPFISSSASAVPALPTFSPFPLLLWSIGLWCFFHLLAALLYSSYSSLLTWDFSGSSFQHSFTSSVYSRGVHSSVSHIL